MKTARELADELCTAIGPINGGRWEVEQTLQEYAAPLVEALELWVGECRLCDGAGKYRDGGVCLTCRTARTTLAAYRHPTGTVQVVGSYTDCHREIFSDGHLFEEMGLREGSPPGARTVRYELTEEEGLEEILYNRLDTVDAYGLPTTLWLREEI